MKPITFQLPDALADQFRIALELTGEPADAVAERFIRQYLAQTFQSAADSYQDTAAARPTTPPPPPISTPPHYSVPPRKGTPDHARSPRPNYWNEWGKAITRIPRWARNPQQNNHKILKAWLELQREMGKVTLDALRARCSNPTAYPSTYVPHFDSNYAQMKFDTGNSHGKVFEEQNGFVEIWDNIQDILMHYRDYFL